MFTKEDTKMIKGVAILLMIFHHLVTFPARVPTEYAFVNFMPGEDELIFYLSYFGKICVALYMFLGGYGLYKQQERPGFRFENNIIRLYKAYWKVFIIFVPIGFLFFANQPVYCEEEIICNVFSEFSMRTFLQNFIGVESTYNREWWFFISYLCTSFCGFLYIKNIKAKRGFWTECFYVIIILVLIEKIVPGICKIDAFSNLSSDLFVSNFIDLKDVSASFFMGIVFARYDGITKLRTMLQSYSLVAKYTICVAGLALIVLTRTAIFGSYIDMFYVPCFIIFVLEIIEVLAPVKKGLAFLGKYSTNMWLIHAFYCYYFYGVCKLVYFTRNRLISFLTLVLLSLISAILLDLLYQYISKGCKKLQESLIKR